MKNSTPEFMSPGVSSSVQNLSLTGEIAISQLAALYGGSGHTAAEILEGGVNSRPRFSVIPKNPKVSLPEKAEI
ncbi:hypothetical protein KGMB02707_04310 [Mesosutterella multiformis]|nr:hypothetical protein KGMB02707_04310 [Mesosutterella multiformis]